jgi:N-dimethylarginine dimethylaminohydrolase
LSSSQPYRVHTLELNPHSVGRWQHTDCIFATPREGLGVIVPEAIKGGLTGLPKFMRDWEFISATDEEAHHLGCNGMTIDHNVTVVGAEHTRLNEELDKHNVEVVPVQYDKVSARGGAGFGVHAIRSYARRSKPDARCSTSHRTSALGHEQPSCPYPTHCWPCRC